MCQRISDNPVIGVDQGTYAKQAGNSSREKCIQALNVMLPKLPKQCPTPHKTNKNGALRRI